ncbi:hypothetical protein [Antiquaquibacter soli]|uniref:Uncharacterized protein n=1 Tax=Antiquaquibacter soli TaxID=3064523 RepID=A0ABT9BMH0_9MICO|nr:hypothetical protein [Protaetiibacter sp. WY-16]MDO7882227.1 hypothetical protein [Protaetiibacter sp. WY-16]
MHELTETELAEILPGTWRIAATNFPMWLSGERLQPQFRYGLLSESPLTLSDEVAYVTTEGEEKQILGKDVLRRGEFVWRGKGLLSFARSRWHVSGADEQRTLLVIRFSKSIATPPGIDLVVREGSSYPHLRRVVASSTEELGLSPEDFASLGWLGV